MTTEKDPLHRRPTAPTLGADPGSRIWKNTPRSPVDTVSPGVEVGGEAA